MVEVKSTVEQPSTVRGAPDFEEGNIEGMNGNVFECYGEALEKHQFTKMMETLVDYISKTIEFPKDVVSICRRFEMGDIEEPKVLTKER